jgi:hypothetical protein
VADLREGQQVEDDLLRGRRVVVEVVGQLVRKVATVVCRCAGAVTRYKPDGR